MKKTKMLKKNKEFSYVFSKGTYYSGEVIEAFILNSRKKFNYLGLAISSKSGHAYQRNRIKRLLRENYLFFEDSIISGLSIVFLLKKQVDIASVDYYKINKDLNIIFKKSNVFEKTTIKKCDENEKNIN